MNTDDERNPLDHDEWALDVTHYPETIAWVPMDPETGGAIPMLVVISDYPPSGKATSIFSLRGQEHVERVFQTHVHAINTLFNQVNTR